MRGATAHKQGRQDKYGVKTGRKKKVEQGGGRVNRNCSEEGQQDVPYLEALLIKDLV